MTIIVGLESNRCQVLAMLRENNAPMMVSANSLWTGERFRSKWIKTAGVKVHLDSGGFVAMKKYGGYRFSAAQYVTLAKDIHPIWWAQMDQCCEPEVAANRKEVMRRIDATAANLAECNALAEAIGTERPMMVMQGWKPEDYVSGPAFDDPHFVWPALVGVGSVCRRSLYGSDGLFAVIGKLDAKLPEYVRFHLFGVKSKAAEVLKGHPRIESVDSMAWAYGARCTARDAGIPCTNVVRAAHAGDWLQGQRQRISMQGETADLFQ